MQHNTQQTSSGDGWSVQHYLRPYLTLLEEGRTPSKPSSKDYTTRKLAQVLRWIKQGRGQGRYESYKPWIPITRGFSSPVSHMVFAALSVHRRNHHFLSKLEHHTGLLLAFLGATEIRECLPLWPTEHPNPIINEDGSKCQGLLEIALQSGIEHGVYVGTDVPYIATIDVMAQLPWSGAIHYVGISCKPDAIMALNPRARERVELDRRYCQEIGAKHLHESGATFHPTLLKNIEAYRPGLQELTSLVGGAQLEDFCGHFNEAPVEKPLHQVITDAGSYVNEEGAAAAQLWRVGAWIHKIDIDLTERIAMLKPVRRGGPTVRQFIARHFLGDAACQ